MHDAPGAGHGGCDPATLAVRGLSFDRSVPDNGGANEKCEHPACRVSCVAAWRAGGSLPCEGHRLLFSLRSETYNNRGPRMAQQGGGRETV